MNQLNEYLVVFLFIHFLTSCVTFFYIKKNIDEFRDWTKKLMDDVAKEMIQVWRVKK